MVRVFVMLSVLVFAGMALVGCRAEVEKAASHVTAPR
jgi:hypothetical protein